MQATGASNRPISFHPFGQVPFRTVCCVAALANSTGYWLHTAPCTPPEKGLARPRKDLEQVPSLVIAPDECIDCAVCIPECPANAIYAEDYLPEGMEIFLQFNKKLAPTLPTITKRKAALPDAEQWRVVSHKLSGLNIAL